MRISRYLAAGLIALAVNIVSLYVCVDLLGLWYLAGSTIAFIVTLLASFLLQKFWTFRERSSGRLPVQLMSYAALATVNIGVNALLMYLFVSVFAFHYLLAQVLSSGTIAVYGFVIYKLLVFAPRP